MKTLAAGILLALATGPSASRASDSQRIDLGNGSSIEVRDGQVTVQSSAEGASAGEPAAPGSGGASASSASASATTRTQADGTTVTTVTSQRDGRRITRTITIGKDGHVVVADPSQPPGGDPTPPKPDAPAASAGGWLGVHSVPVGDVLRAQLDIPDGQGVVLEFVADGGPAASAGLRAHDVVLTLDGDPVDGVDGLRARLALAKPGQTVAIGYLRKGKPAAATATLGQRPPDAAPGPRVASEAGRLLKELGPDIKSGRRGVVVDGKGDARVIENGDPFDLLLNDPKLPEAMKAHLRETRELMKKALPDEAPPAEGGG